MTGSRGEKTKASRRKAGRERRKCGEEERARDERTRFFASKRLSYVRAVVGRRGGVRWMVSRAWRCWLRSAFERGDGGDGCDGGFDSEAARDEDHAAHVDLRDLHRPTAVRTAGLPGIFDGAWRRVAEERGQSSVSFAGGGGIKAAVAHALKAAGQHVGKEPAQEEVGIEACAAREATAFAGPLRSFAPADADTPGIESEQPGVIERGLLHIAGEVTQRRFAAADGLHIDDPAARPGFGRHAGERRFQLGIGGRGVAQCGEQRVAPARGQERAGHEVIASANFPPCAFVRHRTSRDDQVQVRMPGELSGPGMQHRRPARLTAKVGTHALPHRHRARRKHRPVSRASVQKSAQFLRHREGDEEVRHREQLRRAARFPLPCLRSAALRAGAMPAGERGEVRGAATHADAPHHPALRRAAGKDGARSPVMRGREVGTVAFHITGPVRGENFRQRGLRHGEPVG